MTAARALSRALLPLAAVACAAALGCDRPPAFERGLGAGQPLALDRHVVWTLRDQPALFTLDPASMRTRLDPLPATPTLTAVGPDRSGLLLLDDQPTVRWVIFDNGAPETVFETPLTGRYARVAFAPDRRRAVLFSGGADTGQVLQNPNQVAIVDLETGALVERTLRSFGDVPQSIIVSPEAVVAGAERQLAWALSNRYLALFDLAAPMADEVIVHLTLAGDTRTVAPTEVTLAEAGEGLAAFVRAAAADDIFALGFAEGEPGVVPRPYLNQLPAGQRPSDFAVLAVDAGPRVFAVEPSLPGISVIEPTTAGRVAVQSDLPVSRILPFEAERDDGTPGRFALLWQAGAAGVVFADLDRLEEQRGRALTPLVVGGSISDVQPIPGRRMAVGRVGGNRVVILDFDARTATPLDAADEIQALIVAPDGAAIYLVTASDDLAVLATDTLIASTVSLTEHFADVQQLLHVPGADRLVAVLAGPDTGRVVVAPTADLSPEVLQRRDGIFLEGVFDR